MGSAQLDRLLFGEIESRAQRDAIVDGGIRTSYGELRRLSESIESSLRRVAGKRMGLVFRGLAVCFAAMAVLDRIGGDVFLLDGDLTAQEAQRLGQELRLSAILTAEEDGRSLRITDLPGGAEGSKDGSVTILTSGTTGKPKAARHTWPGLMRPVRVDPQGQEQRWLLSYRPQLYAGLQVALQCFANAGTLVAASPGSDPTEVAQLLAAESVEYVSATPSYWRRILMLADPAVLVAARLKQITLGGEVADEQILQWLRKTFPEARVVHIYATTELGRCFSVSDGKAGFPAEFLEGPGPDGVELRIEADELLVRSANAMESYDAGGGSLPAADGGGWRHTGDLIEKRGNRVYFIGRRCDLINVGGNKVSPVEVERIVRAVPGVRDVRVYGKRSSVVGQLVACEVVPTPGADPATVREEINAACLVSLNSVQRPRLIEMVQAIGVSAAGKAIRRDSI